VAVKKITNTKTTMAAKKISEDTEVKLDLKTIAILVGGAISLASMWFTLEGEIQDLNNKIDNFGSEEFVQKMEFQLKDELVRSTIIQIEKSTDVLKEDILDNKQSIKELEDKVYKR
jgi:cell division protein FtsL|tara:strand:+ start:215 stop:562 length:348 start_codon:yes stop_codon:yes gene_type:complete